MSSEQKAEGSVMGKKATVCGYAVAGARQVSDLPVTVAKSLSSLRPENSDQDVPPSRRLPRTTGRATDFFGISSEG